MVLTKGQNYIISILINNPWVFVGSKECVRVDKHPSKSSGTYTSVHTSGGNPKPTVVWQSLGSLYVLHDLGWERNIYSTSLTRTG